MIFGPLFLSSSFLLGFACKVFEVCPGTTGMEALLAAFAAGPRGALGGGPSTLAKPEGAEGGGPGMTCEEDLGVEGLGVGVFEKPLSLLCLAIAASISF